MPRLIFSTFAPIIAAAIVRASAFIARASLVVVACIERMFWILAEPLRLSPVFDERPPRAIGIHEARAYAARLMARERRVQYLPLQASVI